MKSLRTSGPTPQERGARPKRTPPAARAGAATSSTSPNVGALSRTLRRRPERAFDAGILVGVLLAVLAVIVIVENGDRVQFDVLWWTWSTRLWVALSAAAAVGVVIGLLFPVFVRRQRAIRKERREARLALTRLQERKAEPAEPSSSSRAGSPGSAA